MPLSGSGGSGAEAQRLQPWGLGSRGATGGQAECRLLVHHSGTGVSSRRPIARERGKTPPRFLEDWGTVRFPN